ncbi:MAG: T9SS type B sorting domain-containing protein [Flavobacterium sp.]|nr:MAG: T9SS type B sorting domain-containing protein [Flavobacterium sp.]
MVLKKVISIIFFLASSIGYSQLANFNFNVVSTNETCAGNGNLEMTVSNTTTGSEIIYQLYLAPDLSNAIAETSLDSFGSLQSGTYRIVATQSLNGESNSQQQDIVIQDLVVDLDFTVSYETVTACDTTGTVTVNVSSGNPSSYEIISGPVTAPLQSSNIFTGLPSGTYIVRVFDECNDALSRTFTMHLLSNSLTIAPVTLPVIYDSCTTAVASNVITSATGTQIIYPLTITYTIHPPDGSTDQIITNIVTSGPSDTLELSQPLTLYGDQIFDVEILILDNCGNEFQLSDAIDPNPEVELSLRDAPCSAHYFTLLINGFSPPYTITFTDPPVGFDPAVYNPLSALPATVEVMDFGDEENPVPIGNYVVTIVDSCGRTDSFELVVEEEELEPNIGASAGKCGLEPGKVRVSIPNNRKIVSAVIMEAPPSYTEPLPSNITFFVGTDGVLMADLPVGDYVIIVIDDCGDEYTVEPTVPEFEVQGLEYEALPNCDPGSGSVKVSSQNGNLVSLIMTQAPLTYMETLPQDVTFNIDQDSGALYMSDLPAGEYIFKGIDECGFELEIITSVIGYTTTPNGYTLIRNCGSFNLGIFDTGTTVTNQKYWFQKFFSDTNTWGHPYTGVSYNEGSLPTTANSISLANMSTVYNLFITGQFRVVKTFKSFNNGSENSNCIDIFAEFTISEKLIINGAFSLDCNGGSGPSDIVLDVVGVAPFSYSITSPIVYDNNNNNVFTGLAPGIYNFRVSDNCGNIENILVEVGTLVPLARASAPESMLVCRSDTNQVGVFILSDQNTQILGSQNPNDYMVTYHISQQDADSGDSPLDEAYSNVSNPQTIYARVTHKVLDICYATTSFPIFIGNNPILSPTTPTFVCAGTTRTLTADPGFDAYEWTTGETTPSIVVTQPGTYGVTVKNVYQDFTCDNSKEFIVTGSGIASFVSINTLDWSSSSNTITVLVSGSGNYVYSLDDINYQPENTFTNLLPGNYTVYVKDINGCGRIMDTFSLLNYPNFFTPNGDGYNDTWNIKFASFEPNMRINIFDRYGKFIIQLFGDGPGWDGTYNGKLLPSTDYWFVVTREDGTIHKGHFAMKR